MIRPLFNNIVRLNWWQLVYEDTKGLKASMVSNKSYRWNIEFSSILYGQEENNKD